MRKFITRCLALAASIALCVMVSSSAFASSKVSADCKLNGVPLYGKVKVVKNFPDFKVKRVDSFPELKVKRVERFPDDCGEWQMVDKFPDFTIQYVDSFPDLKVKFVSSFPGRG